MPAKDRGRGYYTRSTRAGANHTAAEPPMPTEAANGAQQEGGKPGMRRHATRAGRKTESPARRGAALGHPTAPPPTASRTLGHQRPLMAEKRPRQERARAATAASDILQMRCPEIGDVPWEDTLAWIQDPPGIPRGNPEGSPRGNLKGGPEHAPNYFLFGTCYKKLMNRLISKTNATCAHIKSKCVEKMSHRTFVIYTY